jgi:hypothetical protein
MLRHGRWMAQWRDAECASMRATGEGGQCVLQTSDGCGEREGGVYGGAMMVVCGRWWLSGHLHSRPSLSTRRSLAPTTTSVCNTGSSQHSYPCRSRAYLASALFVRMQSCPILFGREEVPRARELCIRVFGGMIFPRRRVCPTPVTSTLQKKKHGVSKQCLEGHT